MYANITGNNFTNISTNGKGGIFLFETVTSTNLNFTGNYVDEI